MRLPAVQGSAKYAVHSTSGQTWKDTKERRAVGLPHCQFATRFAKLQFYGFAFICTAGAKRDQKWGIIAIETESRFAESGASRGLNLVANCKSRWTNAKIGPWLQNPI